MKIKEIIVVEGKNDTQKLQRFFDCDTIETQGTHLSQNTLKLIQEVQKKRGIIIFTDPDSPGEKIRQTINSKIDGCKNAFIDKEKARTSKKVGVEHALKEELEKSLSHLLTYTTDIKESLQWHEFLELGLSGKTDSSKKRRKLEAYLHIGKSNAKTLFKRLNMMQCTQKECIEILEEKDEGNCNAITDERNP